MLTAEQDSIHFLRSRDLQLLGQPLERGSRADVDPSGENHSSTVRWLVEMACARRNPVECSKN